MISKNTKFTLNGILVFSVLTLSIAYFIQFVLGHKPCNLCLIERYPYLGAVILVPLIFIFNKFTKLLLITILLLFIFGAIVSIYHVGIEQGLFEESFVCNIENLNNNLSKQDLLKQLENSTVVSCKDVTFRFFGFSLATINAIISLVLSGIMLKLIKVYDKN